MDNFMFLMKHLAKCLVLSVNLIILSANHPGVAAIFLIELAQLLFPINVRLIKRIHRATAQIVATIAKITCPSALAQALLDNANPFLSRGILD
jgi:hypothetical protein